MDPGQEEAEDALRDALALVRAVLDDDGEALDLITGAMPWPAVTAGVLAAWIAGLMRANGRGRADLDTWQQSAGLR